MIAGGENGQQIAQISAATVAQGSDVFNAGEGVLRGVSHPQGPLENGAADERTSRLFFDQKTSFVWGQFNQPVEILVHDILQIGWPGRADRVQAIARWEGGQRGLLTAADREHAPTIDHTGAICTVRSWSEPPVTPSQEFGRTPRQA